MRHATEKVPPSETRLSVKPQPPRSTWLLRCRDAIFRLGRTKRRYRSNCFANELPFWDCDAAFAIALAAIHQNELDLAERELTRGDGDRAVNDARCLNLLGAIHDCRGSHARARTCYVRAAKLDRRFSAPRSNLKRWYELTAIGNTMIPIKLGDETELLS